MTTVSYDPAEGDIETTIEEIFDVYLKHLHREGKLKALPKACNARINRVGEQVSLKDQDFVIIHFWGKSEKTVDTPVKKGYPS
jgi:hypothetical protein